MTQSVGGWTPQAYYQYNPETGTYETHYANAPGGTGMQGYNTFTPEEYTNANWISTPGVTYYTGPQDYFGAGAIGRGTSGFTSTGVPEGPIDFTGMSLEQWSALNSPFGQTGVFPSTMGYDIPGWEEYGRQQGWLEEDGWGSDQWRDLAVAVAAVGGGMLALPAMFGTSAIGPAAGMNAGIGSAIGGGGAAAGGAMAAPAAYSTGINMGGAGVTGAPATAAASGGGLWSPGVTAGSTGGVFGSMPGLSSGGHGTLGNSIMSNPVGWMFSPMGGGTGGGGMFSSLSSGVTPFDLMLGYGLNQRSASRMEDMMGRQSPQAEYALGQLQQLDANPEAYLNSPEVAAARENALEQVRRQGAALGMSASGNLEQDLYNASRQFDFMALESRRSQLTQLAGMGAGPAQQPWAGPYGEAIAQRNVAVGGGVDMFMDWALQETGTDWTIR